jgi:hypothetical protein
MSALPRSETDLNPIESPTRRTNYTKKERLYRFVFSLFIAAFFSWPLGLCFVMFIIGRHVEPIAFLFVIPAASIPTAWSFLVYRSYKLDLPVAYLIGKFLSGKLKRIDPNIENKIEAVERFKVASHKTMKATEEKIENLFATLFKIAFWLLLVGGLIWGLFAFGGWLMTIPGWAALIIILLILK